MEKKSGVDDVGRPIPRGGGAVRSIGETFQPNLAMGGGSYRVPLEMPSGPGGRSPRVDLLYNTGFGNGPFGLGWTLSIPFIERRRSSALTLSEEPEYAFSGAEILVPLGENRYAPEVQSAYQVFTFDGTSWTSESPNLIKMRFGSTDESRIYGNVNGKLSIARWLLDTIIFPEGVTVYFDYESDGAQRYLWRIRWSVFRLELEYESRQDPFSSFGSGFEVRTERRCKRIALHQDRLTPSLTRSYDLEYKTVPGVSTSLLHRILVTGWSGNNGQATEARLPPLTFEYTSFEPSKGGIKKFTSRSIPPPPIEQDVTILDYHGTGLPGILRLSGQGGTFWENLGYLSWGPPESVRNLPQGVQLGEDRVRFADLVGNLMADLIVDDEFGGGYFSLDPIKGFAPKRKYRLNPSFTLTEPESYLLDLNGDGATDLLTFRNGLAIALLNEGGNEWSRPMVLPRGDLPDIQRFEGRIRLADMNGDGRPDLVFLRSGRITYWPNLGHGRFGTMRVMEETPEFDVPRPEVDVQLADLDGDGTSDLILIGKNTIQICLNSGGERFVHLLELQRTPALSATRLLLADLTGSSTPGFLWTSEGGGSNAHEAWYLDLLQGVKPYLLRSINNGSGLTVTIDYTTSIFERATDLRAGRVWSGYLPFPVHVVRRIVAADEVTGLQETTEYRYHDGHYDTRARSYMGFGEVEVHKLGTAHQSETLQRFFFHNKVELAGIVFEAGRGQPRRIELLDTSSGELFRVEEAIWEARKLSETSEKRQAYLALLVRRESRRYFLGDVYEAEEIKNEYDEIGNNIVETRRGLWKDPKGVSHEDVLVVETSYASHPSKGKTSFPSRIAKRNGESRLLKHMTFYYDGPPFVGLPLGLVERGCKSRQTEVALTAGDVLEAYANEASIDLDQIYRSELIPGYGNCYVKETRQYRHDAYGNQLETIDALGHHVELVYDPEGISPIAYIENAGPARKMLFDPVTQQVSSIEDINGNVTRTIYDGLGNALVVYRQGAQLGRPTETYEYHRDVIPNVVIQKLRIRHEDNEPGYIQYKYLDGSGRPYQLKTLTEEGAWAVDKQRVQTPSGQVAWERDAYFGDNSNFDPVPPIETLQRNFRYDFAGRLSQESFYRGGHALYKYVKNETRFYGHAASVAFETDQMTPPSRISRADAWGRVVDIVEPDEGGIQEQHREYDSMGRLRRIVSPQGHSALAYFYDLWGNIIRVDSADAGTIKMVFNAGNKEVLRIDADGRRLIRRYDVRGRVLHVIGAGSAGAFEEHYTYDIGEGENLKGRIARVEGDFGSAEYSYSTEGDPIRIRRTFAGNPKLYEMSFSYDNQRHVMTVQYPDGVTVRYERTATGALHSIPGFIDEINYDVIGTRTRIAYSNGVVTTRQHTAGDHLLTEIVTRRNSNQQKYQHLTYILDDIGQVIRIDDQSNVPGKVRNNQTFNYDSHNRVVRATGRTAEGEYEYHYEYDALGNLLLFEESFVGEMDYGHQVNDEDHPNRLVKHHSSPMAEYAYDASGNLTADPEIGNLTFDARHQLVRVDCKDGRVLEYRYDHRGRRTETRSTFGGSTTVRYSVEGLYYVEGNRASKVIFDGDQRVALVPDEGVPLVYHSDRLGNVNAVSHLISGALVGYNEYTPFGRLVVAQIMRPFHGFQGSYVEEETDLLLLGTRYYVPRLGRFLTPDEYMLTQPDRVPALLAAANLYLYGMDNPVNFADPNGQIAFLAVLLIAAAVGAVLGAVGAAANGAQTWDEYLLWILGGAVGAVAAVLLGAIIAPIFGGTAVGGAIAGFVTWTVGTVLGIILTPFLDETNSEAAWVLSFALKWIRSPITSLISTVVAVVSAIGGGDVDLRRGALFVEVSFLNRPFTLGSIVWTPSSRFDANGNVSDTLARHEAYHTRTVAALGEAGFYLTYLTIGGLWGAAETWDIEYYFGVNKSGCGNPFEKTAYTYDQGVTPKPTGGC